MSHGQSCDTLLGFDRLCSLQNLSGMTSLRIVPDDSLIHLQRLLSAVWGSLSGGWIASAFANPMLLFNKARSKSNPVSFIFVRSVPGVSGCKKKYYGLPSLRQLLD